MKETKQDIVILLFFFGIPGICIAIDERSIWPIPLCLGMGFFIYGAYWFYERIKYWRLKRGLDKLTPDQLATLFGDFVNQSQWDRCAKRKLKEFLGSLKNDESAKK